MEAKGYRVTSSAGTAQYWIQANVLKADKMNLRDAQGYLEGAVTGAALGAGITAYNSNSAGATLGVGLAAGLIGMAALKQGTSGARVQTSTSFGDQHKYQTRIVSSANKVNLKFDEARPVLEAQLAKSIAGIF